MNSATPQLQSNFAGPGFWPHSQGQLSSASAPSSSVRPSGDVVTPSQAAPLTAPPSFFYNVPPTSSSALPMSSIHGPYQQSANASQLSVPSGQSTASTSVPVPSLVLSSTVLPPPSTTNSLHQTQSAAVRFPFSAGVGQMMGHFEMFGTDSTMFQHSVRFNPSLSLCSPAPHGGNVIGMSSSSFSPFAHGINLLHPPGGHNTPLPSTSAVSVAAASVGVDCVGLMKNNFSVSSTLTNCVQQISQVGGTGLHQFAMPRVSQQPQLQPAQLPHNPHAVLSNKLMKTIYGGGNETIHRTSGFRPLGHSASGGDVSGRDGGQQFREGMGNETRCQHLFDLSNSSIMSTNPSSATSTASFLSQQHNSHLPQTKQRLDNVSQLKALAFCGPPAAPLKQPTEVAETVKIPKETATIPLERSCTSSSSAGSVVEQRPSQQSQMSCQVCYLAASNGLHFGARTCAACAAFFRRSISDQKRYICKRSQRCVIRAGETLGYRKMCRNCRMKRCLEIGMLPENVQNKRNKRDFYFANALSNAISQQQRQQQLQQQRSVQQQQQLQLIVKGEPARTAYSDAGTVSAKGGNSPPGKQAKFQRALSAAPIDFHEGGTIGPIFGDIQLQQNSEYQQQMAMGINSERTVNEEQQQTAGGETTSAPNSQTKANDDNAPWGITLREI